VKARTGFVSNSSTVSFICDICNDIEAAMDLSIEDAEMRQCVNGHTTCNKHDTKINSVMKYIEAKERSESDDDDHEMFDWSEVPSEFCPVCRMDFVIDSDMLEYLIVKAGMTKRQISDEIKNSFRTYKSFRNFIDKPSLK
jgi:hypothetical protein